jgi:hypothetical protein
MFSLVVQRLQRALEVQRRRWLKQNLNLPSQTSQIPAGM